MRYLILSDIHANWEALQAVLNHAAGKYDEVICCGDLVGYGADPNPVVEWVRANVRVVVRGNHDKACVGLEDLEWFNPVAKAATLWTQRELSAENARYVRQLSKGPVALNGFHVVHGSPLDEDEYLIEISDALQAFPYISAALTFFGHTHLQGGFLRSRNRVEMIGKPQPEQEKAVLELDPDEVYLINPGSVGQPRDGDARAAYILFNPEDRFLLYCRLPYDVATAQAKIRRAGLPPVLADRLAVGR